MRGRDCRDDWTPPGASDSNMLQLAAEAIIGLSGVNGNYLNFSFFYQAHWKLLLILWCVFLCIVYL